MGCRQAEGIARRHVREAAADRALHGHKGAVRSLAFSPDGTVLASCSDDGYVRVWDAPEGP